MMKWKYIRVIVLVIFFFLSNQLPSSAAENPLASPNNIFGIHILFPSEVNQAASLVNTNNGDWGYVTIPIQSGDKDLIKWQKFLNDCSQLHLIPIVRLATEGDYFNTRVWRKPQYADLLDFANFLNSLKWPILNRYILVYNEVNRGDEWGGVANPREYAALLSYATTIFKSRSQDFYIISAGLDNAAATDGVNYDEYMFLNEMNTSVPGIFNQIDGISSHAYPNPGFSTPPTVINSRSIASFQYERQLVESLSSKFHPVFITETGWPKYVGPDNLLISYYQTAFATLWSDKNIVAITPFLLNAGSGPFEPFSFVTADGNQTPEFQLIAGMPKKKGNPVIPLRVLGDRVLKPSKLPVEDFAKMNTNVTILAHVSKNTASFFKWLLGM